MRNTQETHPAYKREDLDITTAEELEEAKKAAGVTTHEQAMQRLESEGSKCADAATYTRMHKAVTVPAEKVPEDIKKQGRKGWIGNKIFRFIDDDGSIAGVDIDYETISSIKFSENWQDNVRQFVEELKKYHFDIEPSFQDPNYEPIRELIQKHKQEVEDELKKQRKKQIRF